VEENIPKKQQGRASVPASIIRTGWKAYATPEELFKTGKEG